MQGGKERQDEEGGREGQGHSVTGKLREGGQERQAEGKGDVKESEG